MAKKHIKSDLALVVGNPSYSHIPIIVVNSFGSILHIANVGIQDKNYKTVNHLVYVIEKIKQEFNFDTIIFEENKLFLDKIDRYPDPYILRNVLLSYNIQMLIEYMFYKDVYILALPEHIWKEEVLNKRVRYSIDLYKSHILYRDNIDIEHLEIIKVNNYYEAVCLSECIMHESLMNIKYQINKGDKK